MATMSALLSATLLLLLLGALTETHISRTLDDSTVPIEVVVKNSRLSSYHETFSTSTVYRGILLGALRRLMASNAYFNFTYTEDPNYGPYLESVNGVAGNETERTYWELLVRTQQGDITRPDVGIGCYIPNENEQIILNFTTW